jgi:hypothetical protein
MSLSFHAADKRNIFMGLRFGLSMKPHAVIESGVDLKVEAAPGARAPHLGTHPEINRLAETGKTK